MTRTRFLDLVFGPLSYGLLITIVILSFFVGPLIEYQVVVIGLFDG